jgi:hypothetical protein
MLITITFHKQLFLMLLAYLTLAAYIIWPDNEAENVEGRNQGPISMTSVSWNN